MRIKTFIILSRKTIFSVRLNFNCTFILKNVSANPIVLQFLLLLTRMQVELSELPISEVSEGNCRGNIKMLFPVW